MLDYPLFSKRHLYTKNIVQPANMLSKQITYITTYTRQQLQQHTIYMQRINKNIHTGFVQNKCRLKNMMWNKVPSKSGVDKKRMTVRINN